MLSSMKNFGFFASFILILLSANAQRQNEPLYTAKGDSVILDPNFSGQPITSIVWSHESGIVAEWFGDKTACYRQYKGRCSLNFSTGALTIRGAEESDNSLYSVEINDNKINSKIQLSVISAHLYTAKGENAVLDPNYAAPFITSIVWSHDSGMAAEWFGGEITCLHHFEGRCSLDFYTGALTITGADESDSGLYSVEINNNKIDSKIQFSVISKVSKPSILEESRTEKTSCNLTCDGDTTDAEPVSYKWFTGDDEIGSDKKLEITKDTKEESFTCMMLNPVSNHSSDSFKNPIIPEGITKQLISILVPIFVILAVVGLAVFFICRSTKSRSFTLKWFRRGKEQGTPAEKKEMLSNGRGGQKTDDTHGLEEVRVVPNQSSAPAPAQDNVGESGLEAQRVTTRVQVSNDGNNSEEAGPSDRNPGGSESPGTSQENGSTSVTCETPVEDPQTVPEPVTNKDAVENSAVSSNNREPTNHKLTEHELNNHESNNHEPTLIQEEVNVGGDGD